MTELQTVFAKTMELAQSLKETQELQFYFAAKAAYEGDSTLQGRLFEYETQRKILAQEFQKETADQSPALISAIRDRLGVLGAEIVENHNYKEYEESKRRVNELMSRVNDSISAEVFGIHPSSCTHDCSTCSGCSGH